MDLTPSQTNKFINMARIFYLFTLILELCSHTGASAPPATAYQRKLTIDSMYAGLKDMEYAVRGHVVIEANKISDSLEKGDKEYPFEKIVYTNIGNPQSLGQKPLTWPRQVMALVDLPDELGIDHPDVLKMFPEDAVDRARAIKIGLGGHGSGAYSHSKGVRMLRESVCEFIEDRDGIPADPEAIFLTNGASDAIHMVLTALIASSNSGVLIPIPQYPIYSATIDLLGGQKVGYYLDEENGWEMQIEELERALSEAREKGIDVNSMVLINPGNPSGSVLSRENLHAIVQFCSRNRLVLLADEVYQENVYDDRLEFVSCKRAAADLGLLEEIELVSFHSVSKGVFGECGRRGGYMELTGIDDDVQDQLYKLASSSLCSSIGGQVMTAIMCKGPQPDDVSYESHEAEKKTIYESLKRRSLIASRGLDAIEGISCQPATGSMYCFPSVELPPKAIAAAEGEGISPDTLYCMSLLRATGLCVIPASGFGQKSGRCGFRTTFLPEEDEMKAAVKALENHHNLFVEKYS